MLRKANLRLLLRQLEKLAETPYFDPELDHCLQELILVAQKLLAKVEGPNGVNGKPVVDMERDLWALTQFLAGSTTKQIPHEVVFAVSKAAEEWTSDKMLVTTAIVQERNFYFKGTSDDLIRYAKALLGVTITAKPVQIALPYIYRHKPLFCVPIFHEVGHYVDITCGLTATSLTQHKDFAPQELVKTRRHRAEHFADIFAAMYVGSACDEFLQQLLPDQLSSDTHPSNASRREVVQDFLNGRPNPVVDMFKAVTASRLPQPLSPRFDDIDISTPFAEVRPVTPKSKGEVFGLLGAAWKFLMNEKSFESGAWPKIEKAERERIVNDLVEKSIRNYMVKEAWGAAADKRRTDQVPGLQGQ